MHFARSSATRAAAAAAAALFVGLAHGQFTVDSTMTASYVTKGEFTSTTVPGYAWPYATGAAMGSQGTMNASNVPVIPTATVEIGKIAGVTTNLAAATAPVNKFLGVPFAKSPPTRFMPPEAAEKLKSNETLETFIWRPACVQQFAGSPLVQAFEEGVFNIPPPQESEDCLYLNVYAPASPAPPGGRAVLFWIYGGSLQFGNAGQPAYDGSGFAAYQDVVVVTTNYRTNLFGFVNAPQLAADKQNLGFMDQRFALEWVQRNIHAFGGDPNKVTIFGQSAGAFSVDVLLTSYETDTAPFSGAILESGQFSYGAVASDYTATGDDAAWNQLVQMLNCSTASNNFTCVQQADATEIRGLISNNSLIFSPVVDNKTLVQYPALARANGNFAKVPILTGTVAQEGRVFEFGMSNLTDFLQTTFGTLAPQSIPAIEAAFPTGDITGYNTPYDVISEIFTQFSFQCSQALHANETAATGVPTWRYYYNTSFPNDEVFPGSGVYHSVEIPSVFGTYSGGPVSGQSPTALGLHPEQLPPTAQQVALSGYLNSVWANFAKNPYGGPGWPALGSMFPETLGVLGANGTSGVTMLNQSDVDSLCYLFFPAYEAAAGMPLPGLNSTTS